MPSGFQLIDEDMLAFSLKVKECCEAGDFNRADLIDAHSRLYRLKDRVAAEKANLSSEQQTIIENKFENDLLIQGLIAARNIGDHVTCTSREQDGFIDISSESRAPTLISANVSAAQFFADNVVYIPGANGVVTINHLSRLTTAEAVILSSIKRAKALD